MTRKVAVITRTKNRPLLLRRCIESVLNQTHQDWLHVIVNDGGDSVSVESLVAGFAARYQGRAQIIHNPTSVGMQNASNLGIRATESEYIAIHDDDDSWHPMFLVECVNHLEKAGPDSIEQGVAVQTVWISEEIDSLGNVVELSRRDYLPFESISLFQTAGRNSFPPIAFLYRRKVHENIGWFNQQFNELGDHDFNLRFLSRYEIGAIHRQLACYHWRHQSNGGSYGNTVTDGLASHRKMLVKMQNHYLREDMANNRVGLGVLLNMAGNMESQSQALHQRVDAVTESLRKLGKKLGFYDRLAGNVFTPWKKGTYPHRVFDNIADLIAPIFSKPVRVKDNGREKANLEAALQQAGIVSLDVFDTALLRLVRKPTDVFLYIQNDVRDLLNRPDLNFVEVRIAAEAESRQEMLRAHGTAETTLENIYSALRRRLGCDEPTAHRIRELELQAEHRLCFANPELSRMAARASESGRKLVFASDMYLPAAEISTLLEKNGFKNAPLFVSCELAVSKHGGELFDRLTASLQCQPNTLLHIGDNAHSDVARAQAKGIGVFHWRPAPAQTPLVDQLTSYSGAWENDLASSLYTGLVRRRRLNHPLGQAEGRAFWEMLGYEVVGPLYHAYLSWIIGQAERHGLKKLFFLARDGYSLVKGFNLFREHHGLKMEAVYLFASRRLWNVPCINRLDEETLEFLTTPNPCMCVADFMKRVGINPTSHEALAHQFGFESLDQRVSTKDGAFISETARQNMRRLMRQFEDRILAIAAQERTKLWSYFEEVGLLAEGVSIVDIGWQASSIKSLHKLLALAGKPRSIPGFYFGTWMYAQPAVDAGCRFKSFFVHLDQPAHHARLVAEGVELLECFFSAPHPTIVGIDRKNGKWEPVHGEPELDANMEAALELMTASAFEFLRDALSIWPRAEMIPPFGYLETVLERLLRHPTRDEAVALGTFSWRNTFGGSGPLRSLAKPPSPWKRIVNSRALQDAYDHAYWKKGFLAQLSSNAKKHLRT